jgi:predicted RNA methylase
VVHSVLELVRPKEEDVVFDLGSGDGRFLLAFAAAIREAAIAPATTKQGSVVVGYELDAALASLSRDHATAAGLAHLVEVREEGNARTFSPSHSFFSLQHPFALRLVCNTDRRVGVLYRLDAGRPVAGVHHRCLSASGRVAFSHSQGTSTAQEPKQLQANEINNEVTLSRFSAPRVSRCLAPAGRGDDQLGAAGRLSDRCLPRQPSAHYVCLTSRPRCCVFANRSHQSSILTDGLLRVWSTSQRRVSRHTYKRTLLLTSAPEGQNFVEFGQVTCQPACSWRYSG